MDCGLGGQPLQHIGLEKLHVNDLIALWVDLRLTNEDGTRTLVPDRQIDNLRAPCASNNRAELVRVKLNTLWLGSIAIHCGGKDSLSAELPYFLAELLTQLGTE